MFGKRHPEERLAPAGTEHAGGLLFLRARGLHDRNDFAGDEGKRDETRREHDTGTANTIFQSCSKAMAPATLAAEEQDEDHACDDRRDGKGRSISVISTAAGEPELRNGPACTRGRRASWLAPRSRRPQASAERRERIGVGDRRPVRRPRAKRLAENHGEGEYKEEIRKPSAMAVRPSEGARARSGATGRDTPAWRNCIMTRTHAAFAGRSNAWSALIAEEQNERNEQHHERNGGRARIVVLLELRDDEQRRNLGPHRHVAGDEHDRPYSPSARAKASAKPVSQAG